MKDITRIHIAKVSYDIELDAKKALQAYIENLEGYAEDAELLRDIEIRITELLAERGVTQNGVIVAADVAAIREQLGEPKEFMGEGDMAIGPDVDISSAARPKLFRDIDDAIIGGVLGGVARFFGINAVWVRLIFIVLLFISAGTLALVYAVLWLVIPPARTAADKLQMNGKPVTLASIRQLNERAVTGEAVGKRSVIVRRIITVLLGIGSTVAAVGVLVGLVTAWVAFSVTDGGNHVLQMGGLQVGGLFPVIVGLALAGILLFVSLCILAAYAAFAQKWTKRIWASGLVIIVLGLVFAAAAVGAVIYSSYLQSENVRQNTIERSVSLPAGFSAIETLTIDVADGSPINYIVDESRTSASVRSMTPLRPTISVKGTAGKIKVALAQGANQYGYARAGDIVTVYGPQLSQLTVTNGSVNYLSKAQDKLVIKVTNNAVVSTLESKIGTLESTLDDSAHLAGDSSAIKTVHLKMSGHSVAYMGNVKTLSIDADEACSADNGTRVYAEGVKDTMIVRNGSSIAAASYEEACTSLSLGLDQDEDGFRRF